MLRRVLFLLAICSLGLSSVGQAQTASVGDKAVLKCSKEFLIGNSLKRMFPILGGSSPWTAPHHKNKAGWFVSEDGRQIETIIDGEWLILLPNKKLIIGKPSSNEKTSRLNCNLSSLEVLRLIEKKLERVNATQIPPFPHRLSNPKLCSYASNLGFWVRGDAYQKFVIEAKKRGLDCGVSKTKSLEIVLSNTSDAQICSNATFEIQGNPSWHTNYYQNYVKEAKRRGLDCGVGEAQAFKSASNSVSTSELTAAQRKAERLEAELAALKSEQQQKQQRINSDSQIPIITILSSSVDDRRGSITGRVTDNIAVAEVRVDGTTTPLETSGSFEWQGFVPAGGLSVVVEAIDTAGLFALQQVRLERGEKEIAALSFERLDPFRGKTAKKNINSLALIIGVSDYELEPDKPALYANRDAQLFQDYAAIKLGVPDKNIFTMINQDADRLKIMKAVKKELLRRSEKNKTDVYVFFAGHGLASSDGSNMFLLPYDGDPELLEDSAIDRQQLFTDIQAISPRSVTVFLDSCYSGGTRAGGTLVASLRPIVIRAKEQNAPNGFTILSAAKVDQTSQSLEEAKHGLFSYFLMKGLEGDADANNDNQITAGELHTFVTDKVERQSGFKQTPDIQGDAGRVLVRFQ